MGGRSSVASYESVSSRKPKTRSGPVALRLYIAGQTPRSVRAISNLRRACDEHLKGKYRVEVIDLLEHPQLAAGDQIIAIPTLVKKLPLPVRKIIGDLSDTERMLVGLELRPHSLPSRLKSDR